MTNRKRQTTIIQPDGTKLVRQWEPGTTPALEWLQRAVGGTIELVPGAKEGNFAYVNEDGIGLKLPANAPASEIVGYQDIGLFQRVMPLLGSVVILEGFPLLGGDSLKQLNPEDLGE